MLRIKLLGKVNDDSCRFEDGEVCPVEAMMNDGRNFSVGINLR